MLQWGRGTTPRKTSTTLLLEQVWVQLQWGRGTTPRKTRRDHPPARHDRSASMGPRHNAAENPSTWAQSSSPRCCFNGAAAQRRGKRREQPRLQPGRHAASMGPRHNAAENTKRTKKYREWIELQWGRGTTPRKTLHGRAHLESCSASMGPRHNAAENAFAAAQMITHFELQWGRGTTPRKTCSLKMIRKENYASMGPRHNAAENGR